jgi:uncharacterized Zn-binding protein involved in type VI secretion
VTATDTDLIQPPGPTTPTPVLHPLPGVIDGALSTDVSIEGRPAATVNSAAANPPPELPIGGTFVVPPANRATIVRGSAPVLVNGRPSARSGDAALTCNDLVPLPVGSVVAPRTVLIGG